MIVLGLNYVHILQAAVFFIKESPKQEQNLLL